MARRRFDSVKWFLYVPALALTAAVTGIGIYYINKSLLGPVASFGAPLRAGDRVYMLTGQWEKKLFPWSSRRGSRVSNAVPDLHVDLWAFDAATVAPVWRKRVQTERNGAMYGRSILGAEGDTVWLLVPSGIMAVSMADGRVIADTARIEERNPQLKGLLPKESRFFRFDGRGLRVQTADGRMWCLDGSTQIATPDATTRARQVILPAYFTPQSNISFLERGLTIPPNHWLGLLTENEAEQFRKNNAVGGLDDVTRRRLWSGRTTEATNFFGKYLKFSDFSPLGQDFLAPGLLAIYGPDSRRHIQWVRNPDSVFVLHRDRLGEEGRLQLARVAGPDGRLLWNADLPLSVLQSVMPGDKSYVLYGRLYRPRTDDRPRDPMHTSREMLIAVDLATGNVRTHDQSAVNLHIKATR